MKYLDILNTIWVRYTIPEDIELDLENIDEEDIKDLISDNDLHSEYLVDCSTDIFTDEIPFVIDGLYRNPTIEILDEDCNTLYDNRN